MFCILLEYKHISYCLIWSEKPKSLFLVFWQMWMMARRFIFLTEEQKNMFLSCELWVMSREVWDHSITCFLCSSISQKTKLQSWWSCWTRFSICPRWSINIGSQWDPEICDWARAETSLLELCRAWANWTTLNKLFAFAHRKHLIFFWMRYGQDDICVLTTHCSQLIAHNSSLRPPQQRSIRCLSCGIHTDLCRARVII